MKKVDFVTVTADVDVYLDEYLDEFLNLASDEDLIEEIERRGHKVYKKESYIIPFGEQPIRYDNPADLKRHLCDILNVGYYISDKELINELKIKLQ